MSAARAVDREARQVIKKVYPWQTPKVDKDRDNYPFPEGHKDLGTAGVPHEFRIPAPEHPRPHYVVPDEAEEGDVDMSHSDNTSHRQESTHSESSNMLEEIEAASRLYENSQ